MKYSIRFGSGSKAMQESFREREFSYFRKEASLTNAINTDKQFSLDFKFL